MTHPYCPSLLQVPAAPAYYSFQDWGNGNNIEADPVTSLVSCTALGSPSPAPAPSTGLDVTLSVTGATGGAACTACSWARLTAHLCKCTLLVPF